MTINGFFPGSDYDYAGLTNKEGRKLMTVPMILLAVGVVVTGVFARRSSMRLPWRPRRCYKE